MQDEAQPGHKKGHRTRRMNEQRWLIDNVIQANGIDWDQPRSFYLAAPCGPEANADFAAIRMQVKKLADAAPAFEVAARRREARAQAAEADGALVTARDNYFIAAIHWGAAQWPIDEVNDQQRFYDLRKRECFAAYARLADHHVEAVSVPLGDKALPGWFHLPPGYDGGPLPAVVSIPGMDSFKEMSVGLNGDAWLGRGFAVLAIDGPGQYEAPLLDIPVTMEGWAETGRAAMDWLVARPEVDADKIGITGVSFGSFFATIAASREPRFKACAVAAVCHEPGFHTIFEEASPTFKERFMYMSAIDDEDEFDRFRQSLTWEGYAGDITMPYLCVAGEFDELSPLEHSENLLAALKGPRRFVVYQGLRHALGGPSANTGPFPWTMIADWMADRIAGKPFETERWYVETTGRVVKSAL